MSGLRHVADTSLQDFDFDAETGQDFYDGISTSASFGASGNRRTLDRVRDPSLIDVRTSLERQFEATRETLAIQQRQALRTLQDFCIEALSNPSSSQQQKVNMAWSEQALQPIALPGNPVAQSPSMNMQRPCTPAGFAPEMPDPLNSEVRQSGISSPRLQKRSQMTNGTHSMFTVPPEDDVEPERPKMMRCFTRQTELERESLKVTEPPEDEALDFYEFKEKRKKTSIVQQFVMEHIDKDKKVGADPTKNPQAQKCVFADAAAMKEKVKENIMKPEYNVAQYYKTEGCAQSIARSTIFDNVTLFIIFLNALWIWIDTDYNDSPTLLGAHIGFQIGENLFCVYFVAELGVRFTAFKVKRDGLRDAWFVFDSALVFMMVMETWLFNIVIWLFGVRTDGGMGNASILRLVRLLRLTRMARMARLMRAIPELMILVKGISVAARSVLFTLLLLFVILYVFAIAFRQLCADSSLEDTHFKSVPEAMNTLLLNGVLPDQGALVTQLGDVNLAYGFFVILFILLSSLTIMNMLVGVLCEVVSVVSSVEKEQMMVNFVKSKLQSLIQESGIDQDNNLRISRDEFEALLLLPEGARVIQEVGVDVVGLVDFADHIFKEGSELSFADVMELVLQLRGTNTATVRDVVDLRKFLTQLATESHDQLLRRMTEIVEAIGLAVHDQLEKKLNQHSAVAGKLVAKSLSDYLTYDVESSVV